MYLKAKNHLFGISALCSAFLMSAHAVDNCPPPKPVCNVPCDTPPAGQVGPYCEILPNAGPQVCDGANVFLTGTFIWWNSRQEGQAYVSSGLKRPPASTSNIGRGSVSHAFESWDPGFKVGLGLNLAHDGWDIYAEYTWLQARDSGPKKSRARADADALLVMWDIGRGFLRTSGGTPGAVTQVTSSWKNRLNVIDVELGRNFLTSQYLSLRPFWGIKGTWQSQKYTVNQQVTDSLNVVNDSRMKNNQDYWAVGLRSGLNSMWHFNDSFALYGDLALSALWASFDVERKDTFDSNINAVTTEQTHFNTRNDYSMGKGVLETEIGLQWETWFSNDDYHFALQAGWEYQIWFSHNNLFRFFEESAHGDMTYMGLNIKLRFDF